MTSTFDEHLANFGLQRQGDLDFDRLRELLHEERDRRLNAKGVNQFRFVEKDPTLSTFEGDPWTEDVPREPVVETVDVFIVGAGFGGLSAAIAAKKAGAKSVRLCDRAGGFGGTWYWNRYPGIRCDVDSRVYLPYLEESGFMPTERYSRGEEILAFSNELARQHGLLDAGLFHTAVTEVRWDESAAVWEVTTDRGDRIMARFVVTHSGLFMRPKLPGIAGIETFRGAAFHSSRWDYAYTGGNEHGGLTGLHGKRVALIGTGASAIQILPHLARAAAAVVLFQRTPTVIAPRHNAPLDASWFEQQEPGWQLRMMDNFSKIMQGQAVEADLVDDGWTLYQRFVVEYVKNFGENLSDEDMWVAAERADLEWFEMLNANIDAQVRDPEKAALLKSHYRYFCKRPGFSDEYLPALDSDNVRLIDSVATPIESITETGIRVRGIDDEIEVDCIIFATGFEIGTSWTQQAGYDPVGVGGLRLSEKWKDGPRVLHGMMSSGFPNFFIMGVVKTGGTISYTHLLRNQAEHIGFLIEQCRSRDADYIDASKEAEDEYTDQFPSLAVVNKRWYDECTPGYLNNEGNSMDPSSTPQQVYAPGPDVFWRTLEEWRQEGSLAGLDLRVASDRRVVLPS